MLAADPHDPTRHGIQGLHANSMHRLVPVCIDPSSRHQIAMLQENKGIMLFLPFCLTDMEAYGISQEVVQVVTGAVPQGQCYYDW